MLALSFGKQLCKIHRRKPRNVDFQTAFMKSSGLFSFVQRDFLRRCMF